MPGSVEMMTAHKMVKFRQEPQDPGGKARPRLTPIIATTTGPKLCSLTFPHQQSTPVPSSNLGPISAPFLHYFCALFGDLFWSDVNYQPLAIRNCTFEFSSAPRESEVPLPSADCLSPRSARSHAEDQRSHDHRESNSNQGSLKVGSRLNQGSVKVQPRLKPQQSRLIKVNQS